MIIAFAISAAFIVLMAIGVSGIGNSVMDWPEAVQWVIAFAVFGALAYFREQWWFAWLTAMGLIDGLLLLRVMGQDVVVPRSKGRWLGR